MTADQAADNAIVSQWMDRENLIGRETLFEEWGLHQSERVAARLLNLPQEALWPPGAKEAYARFTGQHARGYHYPALCARDTVLDDAQRQAIQQEAQITSQQAAELLGVTVATFRKRVQAAGLEHVGIYRSGAHIGYKWRFADVLTLQKRQKEPRS